MTGERQTASPTRHGASDSPTGRKRHLVAVAGVALIVGGGKGRGDDEKASTRPCTH